MTLQGAGAILRRLLRRLEGGEAEPGVVTAASAAVRTLASLEQVTAIEERIAALEEAAAAVGDARGRALRHLADR